MGLAAALLFLCPHAEARKHRFKGVIVVNQILKLDGTINNNGKQAMEYSGVHQGDVLETGDKSTAVIRIPGLAIFKMYANTRLKLAGFNDRNESRFEIEKGSVLNVFRRPGHHVVTLSHGVLTLHGTTFLAKVSENDDEVCLCDGKISALVKGQKRKTASVTTTPTPTPTSTPVPPSTATSSTTNPNEGPTISAAPTPAPSAEVSPVPSPAPSPIYEIEVSSSNEHKQFAITADGIEVKDLNLLNSHTNQEIQDLNSLYDLP